MKDIEEFDLNRSLQKASKVCQIIRYGFIGALCIYLLMWVSGLIAIVASGEERGFGEVAGSAVYVGANGLIVALFLLTMIKIFSSVVKQAQPFSEKQADRLRLVALLALGLVILELVYTATVSYSVVPEVGYNIGINDAYPADSVNLNAGMLVFSAIMYSLSALFRYAALLQQLSQDTV